MDDFFSELLKTNIFRGLSEPEIETLLKGKPVRLKHYTRDECIAGANDVCHDMLFVIKGSVRGEMTDFSGRKLKIEDIVSPRPLAAAFIFGKDNRFPVDIYANEPAIILTIPRDVLLYILQHNRTVLQNYLNAISSRTQFLSNKIRFLSFKTIKEKIANYVLNHLRNDGRTVVLDQSQTELAEYFGVTRPSLARAMAEMEADGLLHAERREITLLDKEKLNKLVQKS
jgi:CRP/FNR family transcriptional regulator, dissimilatory nitrate respiration regulator